MGYVIGQDNVPNGTVLTTTIIASGAIAKNRFVSYSNAECTASARPKGISVTAIGDGSQGEINIQGIAIIELSGDGHFAGDEICSGANGVGVAQSGSNPVGGYALEDGDDGDFIQIFLT